IGETGGSFGLIKTGAGVLAMDGDSLFSGETRIEQGAVIAASDGALSQNSAHFIAAGAFLAVYDGMFPSIASLAGAGDLVLDPFTAAANPIDTQIVIGTDGTSVFSGRILGNGSFVTAGDGSLTLTGDSEIAGGFVVSGGTDHVFE